MRWAGPRRIEAGILDTRQRDLTSEHTSDLPRKETVKFTCNTLQHIFNFGMQKSVTTSVRLPRGLRRKIERKAAAAGCGRNRVIINALEFYLKEDEQAPYEAEARLQSQLASRLDPPDAAWEKMVESDFPGP
jgi:hypothetical protein